MKISDFFGWIGMITVLIAYFLLSFDIISSQGFIYQFLNFIGVILIAINVFVRKAWAVFVLECVWGLIALVTIIKIIIL